MLSNCRCKNAMTQFHPMFIDLVRDASSPRPSVFSEKKVSCSLGPPWGTPLSIIRSLNLFCPCSLSVCSEWVKYPVSSSVLIENYSPPSCMWIPQQFAVSLYLLWPQSVGWAEIQPSLLQRDLCMAKRRPSSTPAPPPARPGTHCFSC